MHAESLNKSPYSRRNPAKWGGGWSPDRLWQQLAAHSAPTISLPLDNTTPALYSPTGHTFTAVGTAPAYAQVTGRSVSPYEARWAASGGLTLSGTSGAPLSADWSCEMLVESTLKDGSNRGFLDCVRGVGGPAIWLWCRNTSGFLAVYMWDDDGTQIDIVTAIDTTTLGKFMVLVVVDRVGGFLHMYVNGAEVGVPHDLIGMGDTTCQANTMLFKSQLGGASSALGGGSNFTIHVGKAFSLAEHQARYALYTASQDLHR